MKLRLRWYGSATWPRVGGYLVSGGRARGGYLILSIVDRGKRGGLGEPVHHLLIVEVERATLAQVERGPYWSFEWDRRKRRVVPLAEFERSAESAGWVEPG